MVGARINLLEAGAPAWAGRMALRIIGAFVPLEPSAPVRLPSFVSTSLPDAAAWVGCAIYVPDKAKIGLSNGTGWTNAIGGAL